MERTADIIDIFEEVEMLSFHTGDDTVFRMKMQETVGIFAGLGNEYFWTTYADISTDCF